MPPSKSEPDPAAAHRPDAIAADPVLRRRLVLGLPAAAAAGAAALYWMQGHLEAVRAVASRNPEEALALLRRDVVWIAALNTLVCLAFGAHTGRFLVRAYRTGRLPPPGTRVVRETVVLQGDAARRRAVAGLIVLSAMVASALAAPLVLWWILETLGRRAAG